MGKTEGNDENGSEKWIDLIQDEKRHGGEMEMISRRARLFFPFLQAGGIFHLFFSLLLLLPAGVRQGKDCGG